jgi:alkyl hydroperoxide reductase subunit AhpC
LVYLLLPDFHPKGAVAKDFDVWNDEFEAGRRAVIIVDKDSIIQYKRIWSQCMPDPVEILEEILKLNT